MTDEQSESLFRANDLAALVARLWPRTVLWAATEMSPDLRSSVEPEDIAQEIAANALRDLSAFRGSTVSQFRAWFFKIAAHTLINLVDRRGARKRQESPRVGRPVTSPLDGAVRVESSDRVARAISYLSPDHRLVIRLIRIEEQSTGSVALLLGRTEGGVRVLLHRALKALADELERS